MSRLRWYWERFVSYVGRPRLVVQEKAVVLSADDFCEEPIFLIGAHRSGTSLVRRMFNSHPEIACPPETFFFRHYAAMLEDPLVASGYEAFGFDRDEMRADLARAAARHHEAYRIATGKKVWADKTPRYVEQLDGIDRLFAHRPKYVMILRHPGDIVFSIASRGWRFNDEPDLFESALRYTKNAVECMQRFETANTERCCRLIYERLTEQPAEELARVCNFLGHNFSDEMLRFGDHSHNYGLEDPVVRGKSHIAGSHGAWRDWPPERIQRLQATFGPAFERRDYWSAAAAPAPAAA